MARPSLQLVAGLLVLAGLLGLSTALIAEVREEVLQADEDTEGDPAREVRKRTRGLPVPELTLLDPTRTDIPDREQTSGGFHATGPGSLFIGEEEGIQPGPLTLPEGTRLEVGEGWDVDDERFVCEQPCQLDYEDAQLALPADTAIVPPEATAELELGTALEPGDQIALPADTRLKLPQIRFPLGTQLDLAAGAQAELPDRIQDPSAVLDAEPLQLPPGTVVTRSTVGEDEPGELARLLDQAGRPDAGVPDGLLSEPPTINVTDTPATIEKGRPFTVRGHVEDPEGQPLADHPVTVFANATKQAPGKALHEQPTRTDRDGTFTARLVLPERAPTRPYHLLAHAHPRLDTEPPLAGAWSDPVVPVEGEATLDLDLPDTIGVGVPLGLRATLTDAYEAPVPNQTIGFAVEGTDEQLTARTNAEGEALAVLESGLAFTGNYSIHGVFPGTGNITGDNDEATIEAIDARIEAPATHTALRGTTTEIDGRVVAEDGGADGVRVKATYANVTETAPTDDRGAFTLELPLPEHLEPGNHTVELEAGAIDARHQLVLTAQTPITLTTPRLGPQPVGAQLPMPVDAVLDDGTPVPGIRIDAQHEAADDHDTTDASGRAHLSLPLPQAGTYTVHLDARTPLRYVAEPTQIALTAAPLEVDADVRLPPGRATETTLELTVDETPLAQAPIQLVGPGFVGQATTGPDGKADLRLTAPENHPPGLLTANLTLPAHGVDEELAVRVLEDPQLSVSITQPPHDGEPLTLDVTARTDRAPLADVPILVRAQGAFEATGQALTGGDGTAQLTLPRPDDAEGPLEVTVLAEATPTTARVAETASTQTTPSPTPWGWIALGTGALGLAAAAGLRHHRGSRQPPEPSPPSAHLSLRIAPQTDGYGPVWHPEEPTTMVVELVDAEAEPVPGASVRLEGPPGTAELDLDDHGRARTHLPPQEPGTHTYRATGELADGETLETVLELRIVDYREEIDRQYRRLRETAVRVGLVGPDATPRELGEALGPPADELARLFERFDYAPHPVDRGDYERFMQLLEEADPR